MEHLVVFLNTNNNEDEPGAFLFIVQDLELVYRQV